MLAELAENEDPESVELFAEQLDAVNKLLTNNRLPKHTEPRSLPPLDDRCGILGYPYSFLHYLRRAYAHRELKPNWVAEPLRESGWLGPMTRPLSKLKGRRKVIFSATQIVRASTFHWISSMSSSIAVKASLEKWLDRPTGCAMSWSWWPQRLGFP